MLDCLEAAGELERAAQGVEALGRVVGELAAIRPLALRQERAVARVRLPERLELLDTLVALWLLEGVREGIVAANRIVRVLGRAVLKVRSLRNWINPLFSLA